MTRIENVDDVDAAQHPGGETGSGDSGPDRALPSRAVGALVDTVSRRGGPAIEQVVAFVVCLALGISVGLVLAALTGHPPGVVLADLIAGSVGDQVSLGYTLVAAAPLLLVAAGVIVCMRAGQFNIGQEGQVTAGAVGAAFVVFHVSAPGTVLIVLSLLAAAAAGGLWAGLAALLKVTRGVDIVVSSLLLVFLAEQIMLALISGDGPLHDDGEGALGAGTASQSPPVPDDTVLGGVRLFTIEVPVSFLLALVAAGLLAWFLRSAYAGYRLRILGQSPVVARTIGISPARMGTAAVVASGAFAGVAGAVVLLGQTYQLYPQVASAVGWNGLLVALAARMNAGMSVLLALVFGAMTAGGGLLGIDGVPIDIVNVMGAAIVLALLCPPLILAALRRRRQHRAAKVGE